MRISSLLTLLCSIAALVLGLLSLLAGYNTSFLPHAEILTLNISRIGHTSLFNTSDSHGIFTNIVNGVETRINKLVQDSSADVARALNLSDFYSIHVMDYCRGYYEPNTTTTHASENVTWCSDHNALFNFNPTTFLQQNLPSGITLQDLNWPEQINDASATIRAASKAMFACYIIGIVFAGLAAIGAIVTFFTHGRLSICCNGLVLALGFLSLGAASALATVIMVKAVDVVNQYGKAIGIAAYKGVTFLGLTWGATAAMFVALVISAVQCCSPREKRKSYHDKTTTYQ